MTKSILKNYVKKAYILNRYDKSDVYNSIKLGHLNNKKQIDNYINKRFNISKFGKTTNFWYRVKMFHQERGKDVSSGENKRIGEDEKW